MEEKTTSDHSHGLSNIESHEYDAPDPADEFILEWPLVGAPSRHLSLVGDQISRPQSIHTELDADGKEVKTNWASLHIANVLAFFCAIEFSLFTTAIYPYLQQITCGATTQTFYGVVVAVFSMMQGISSPIYGYWANVSASCKWPIITGAAFMLVGNVMYALAEVFIGNSGREWAVLGSRLIMGCGAGIVGVIRAYVATASTAAERTKAVSINMAAFTTGIALGPALNILFAFIGYPGLTFSSTTTLGINMYTVTGYFGAATMIIMFLIIIFFFKESYSGIMPEGSSSDLYHVLPKPKVLPVCLCLYLWFAQQTAVSSVESLLSPFCIIMYDWNGAQALTYTGYMILLLSCVGMIIYMLYAFTALGNLDTRISMLVGLSLMSFYYFLTYPWPFFTGKIQGLHVSNATMAPYINVSSATDYYTILQTTTMSIGNHSTDQCAQKNVMAGCDLTVDPWCSSTPQVPLILFALSFGLVFGSGFAPTTSSLGVMYSKVLGPRRQGTMQGVLLITGSTARTFGPVIALSMFDKYGPGWTWLVFFIVVFAGVILVIVFYKRLVPLVTLEDIRVGQKIVHDNGVVYKF